MTFIKLYNNLKEKVSICYQQFELNKLEKHKGRKLALEIKEIISLAIEEKEAARQEKIWKQKKEQCQDRIGIHLKDTEMLKGNIGGVMTDIAKWKETGGGKRLAGLTEIKKREDGETIEKYLNKKGLIKESAKNRKPSFCVKSKDLEEWESEENNNKECQE